MNWLRRLCEWLLRHRHPVLVVAVGMALGLPSLWVGLQSDDLMIRAAVVRDPAYKWLCPSPWQPFTFLDGDPERNRMLMDLGWLNWWSYPRCRAAFLRPVTALTHIVDFRGWPRWPAWMHVQSLVWYGLLVWAVARLYRRLIGRAAPLWVAALASLLFAIDDAHGMPAGWLANRNSTLGALFGVLALLAHDRWRRDGWRPGAALGPVLLLVALLAKEEAASAAAYLLAYALFLDQGSWRRRAASLVPYLVVGVAWQAAYRWLGYGLDGLGVYSDPVSEPLRFARRVVSDAPVLLLGQFGVPASDTSLALSASAFRLHWLWALVYLGLVAAAVAPLVARRPLARFFALGAVLSVVPPCMAFPGERLLMYVGLGAMGLLALWLGGRAEGAAWQPASRWWRRLARVLAVVFVAVHLVIAPLTFPLNAYSMRFAGEMLAAAYHELSVEPELDGRTVVFVNSVCTLAQLGWVQTQRLEGRPVPARILTLTPSCVSASVTRKDATTLVVRPRGGYLAPWGHEASREPPAPALSVEYALQHLDMLFRSSKYPMRLGERVELSVARVEITALTDDGRPAEATFRFRVPLDDPSLRWFAARKGRYAPWTPPAVGATVRVEPPLR